MQIQSEENTKFTQKQGRNIIHNTYTFQHFPFSCLFSAHLYPFFPFFGYAWLPLMRFVTIPNQVSRKVLVYGAWKGKQVSEEGIKWNITLVTIAANSISSHEKLPLVEAVFFLLMSLPHCFTVMGKSSKWSMWLDSLLFCVTRKIFLNAVPFLMKRSTLQQPGTRSLAKMYFLMAKISLRFIR